MMAAHGEDRRAICPVCQKRFSTQDACKQHMKRKRHTPWLHDDDHGRMQRYHQEKVLAAKAGDRSEGRP